MFNPKTALVFSRSAFSKKNKSKRFWLSAAPEGSETTTQSPANTLEMCCQNKIELENKLKGLEVEDSSTTVVQSKDDIKTEIKSIETEIDNLESDLEQSKHISTDSDDSSVYLDASYDDTFSSELVYNKMQRLHETGMFMDVLSTFEDAFAVQKMLNVDAYNLVLSSLAFTSDVSTQLQAFEKMLANGIKPDQNSYSIVCNNLTKSALEIDAKRKQAAPYLGPPQSADLLESVEEAYETLSVQEPLFLALNILSSVLPLCKDSVNESLQQTIDCLFSVCVEFDIKVPDYLKTYCSKTLPGFIEIQPSLQKAVETFESMPEIHKTQLEWQKAMLKSYFKFDQVPGAIAFFAACNSPKLLLKPLLVGFASRNLVGTARQWVQKTGADNSAIAEVINSTPSQEAAQVLPSVYKLYNRYLCSTDVNDSSVVRSSFIKLCIASGDSEKLFIAIKESHINGITWDAVTIKTVVEYLVDCGQPMLAADICSWQVMNLHNLLTELSIKSFACQEITTELAFKLVNTSQLTLPTTLRLLPVAFTSNVMSTKLLDLLEQTKACELSLILDADLLNASVFGLSKLMIKFKDGDRAKLKPIFAKFVRQSIDEKVPLSSIEHSLLVLEALKSCDGNCCLVRAWKAQNPCEKSDAQAHKNSMIIHLFASNPYGLERALDLYKSQRALDQPVSTTALRSLLKACLAAKQDRSRESKLEMTEEIYSLSDKLPASLDVFIAELAKSECHSVAINAYKALTSTPNGTPSPDAYAALIESAPTTQLSVQLLRETELSGVLTADIYNACLANISKSNDVHLSTQLLEEASNHKFDITAETYAKLIAMHIHKKSPKTGFKLLKSIPILPKSLVKIKTYNQLMRAFLTKNDSRGVLAVFSELKSVGILPNSESYQLLMESFVINSNSKFDLERAENVLNIMQANKTPVTADCLATLVRARGVQFRDFIGACELYEFIVKDQRVKPNLAVYKALADTFIANGVRDDLPQLAEEISRFKITPDSELQELLD